MLAPPGVAICYLIIDLRSHWANGIEYCSNLLQLSLEQMYLMRDITGLSCFVLGLLLVDILGNKMLDCGPEGWREGNLDPSG